MSTTVPDDLPTSTPAAPTDAPAAGPKPGGPMLDSVVRGVHETVDRVAASAAPAIDRLVGGAQDASGALEAQARQVGELGREWADSLRATVREHPIATLAAALAVGVLIGHLGHGDRH